MATYVKAYLGTQPLFSSDASTWTRPADWLTLPAASANTVRGLHAVFNNTTNFATVRMQTSNGAAYTIDWGDGIVESAASNTIIQHNYVWSNVSSATITSGGYRQALVTITPPTGATFSYANFGDKYSSGVTIPATTRFSSGWLDMNINLPNLPAGQRLLIGSTGIRHGFLERVNITSWGAITNASNMFSSCTALREANSAQWNTAAITDMSSMFYECWAFQVLDASTWNTALVTTMNSMFRACYSLIEIKCSAWNTGALQNLGFFCFDCRALSRINVSAWNTINVTTLQFAFNGCASLPELSIGSWTLTNLTNALGVVRDCWNLRDTNITTLSLPAATNMNQMFEFCFSLPTIGTINVPSGASTTALCSGAQSLKSAGFIGINSSTSFANCMLSGPELDNIYTNLSATGTGKTITVTGNFGTATHNPSIATAKGWTVTV
jgi:surface protein